MSVINTNYLALVSQNNLSKSQGALGTAIERLSSGLRINSAKDDAAGQAIANRFTANIKGLTQAARNANDGISLAQTAEGALNEINSNLQRVRELTVQAQNGTNSASDIDSIQEEVNQRIEEIDRIAKQTNFNGINVLAGAADATFDIQVGALDGEQISISISNPTFTARADADNAATGWLFDKDASIDNTDGDEPLNLVNGEARTVAAKGFDVLSGTVSAADYDAGTVGEGFEAPLKTIDAALAAVDSQRSDLGAIQNRFESTIANLNNTINNLSAARSRIEDADYAVEVSNMTRAQILQQAGTSVLAQANQVPQGVLSLLR
ncbi:flagellin N-terminal helical domain-containing protein [Alcaligenes faecalis]|uniref:flagellin N-terminal helical domain-containing protein n=1 Tax=Alcaligenes faecalis TaxID=511 RepID=UPI0005AB1989|nr:flagellin [Alcaligenes faecalis]ATH99121.1 flagellin FliC [Alcaligenes faecalis]AYZ91908.1 flagellin FliC [Alcaligenes faecalis]MCX5595629.1 flagellin [Alcaligenes faecalis]QQC32282.1 flagellin FliC [Alcaligenes faecalis]CAJ0900168.1 flagellar filament structural protein [Alcaligenes faecalis subsp. faecalis]